MSNQLSNDKLFAEMMQSSKLEMPFSDFEDRTMARINREIVLKSSLSTYKKLAVLFFTIGTGFGFGLTYFLSLPETTIAGISSDTLLLLCRAAYVLLFLTQLNSIIGLLSPLGKYRFR